jgi:hypothetical protein
MAATGTPRHDTYGPFRSARRSAHSSYGAKFQRTCVLIDLEEEIHYHYLALAASPPDYYIRRMSLFSLGKAFQKQFFHDDGDDGNKDVRHLEKSIACCRDALELCPRGQMSRFEPLRTLAVSLSLRSSILLQAVDFEESMVLFRSALEEEYAHPHAKYENASKWAACARVRQHPPVTLAYETAISLMQGSLTIGPTFGSATPAPQGTMGRNTFGGPTRVRILPHRDGLAGKRHRESRTWPCSGRRCAGYAHQWTSFRRMAGWQRRWQSGSRPSAKNWRTSLPCATGKNEVGRRT